ncbi:hypothetical protein TNCV_4927881, partial [Trichonephila clavipes]
TWQRRGYTSMNGCVAAISVDTGKVLDIEVMSFYCPTFRDFRLCLETLNMSHQSRPHMSDDEAHFWLNGYVNKQNCRIWSEANPQVYVETPLHPEKLTVWCALWAVGILLQKR